MEAANFPNVTVREPGEVDPWLRQNRKDVLRGEKERKKKLEYIKIDSRYCEIWDSSYTHFKYPP